MANNRMWLIHKPSKLGVRLGRRMGWGWDTNLEMSELQRFFNYLADNPDYEGSQDDFIIALEVCSDTSCFGDWQYTDEKVDGFYKFKIPADSK